MSGLHSTLGFAYQAALRTILAQIDLGKTFCNLARSTANPERQRRNIENASKAYHTALHFLNRFNVLPEDNRGIEPRLRQLRVSLDELKNENFGER